jgi:hypothetical protein
VRVRLPAALAGPCTWASGVESPTYVAQFDGVRDNRRVVEGCFGMFLGPSSDHPAACVHGSGKAPPSPTVGPSVAVVSVPLVRLRRRSQAAPAFAT